MKKLGTTNPSLRLSVAMLLVTLLAGCVDHHAENVANAKQRYKESRALLMLPLAVQQFEAGDLQLSLRTVSEAIEVDPDNASFYVLSGQIALERGQLERAYHILEKAVELNEKLPTAQYYLGVVFQRWQKYDDALDSYEQAYKLEPDRASYLLARVEMLMMMDRDDAAIALLESKLTYFAHHAGLRAALGQIYMMRQDHQRALKHIREASLLKPRDFQLQEELANVLLSVNQPGQAVVILKALLTEPQYLQRADLRRALAAAYVRHGRKAQALRIYRRLVQQDREDKVAWLRLAEVSWSMGDLTSTLRAVEKVIRLDPDNADGYLLAGLAWQRRGQLAKAIGFFAKAQSRQPGSNTPMILKGIAHQRQGQLAKAADAYAQAVRQQPDDARAQQLLAKLTNQ